MRGEPRALGAERFLDYLDQDFLAGLEQFLDLELLARLPRLARFARPAVFALALFVVSRLELLELHHRIDDFGDVEEAVAFEPDVDE